MSSSGSGRAKRFYFWCVLMISLTLAAPVYAGPRATFDGFIRSFEAKAVRAGISSKVYREATARIKPIHKIPGLVATQPEFTTPIWEYVERRVSAGGISLGRKAMKANRPLFNEIGQIYGVDPAILGAIWSVETSYGAVLDNKALIQPVVPSLATLVHHRRQRLAEDELELIAALRLIQDYGWTADSLVGSWAGAIGHLQIIVSALVAHGTDGDGDGLVNPIGSLADALATTAVYLRALGYQPGLDWGFEVELPPGFDYTNATRTEMKPVGFFARQGVRRVKARQFVDLEQPVFLYVPAGRNGPKFLMTRNYLALKGYNFSDSYALSVAHLADRLKGTGGFAGAWPRSTKFPNSAQRVAIQRWLKRFGFYAGEVDGRIGPISQEAYQKFQVQRGLVADGFITMEAFELLRAATE